MTEVETEAKQNAEEVSASTNKENEATEEGPW